MSERSARCPNCGADIEFRLPGGLFVVCPYCSCSSYRGDVELEKVGMVAERAPIASHFQIGTCGTFQGKRFEVVGQLQLDHGLGLWNEWCAMTGDGWFLWIAEAQGELWVMWEEEGAHVVLDVDDARPGRTVELGEGKGRRYRITEVGEGQVVTAAGEFPIRIQTGETTRYADMASGERYVGTLDWTRSNSPEVMVGERAHLRDLALEADTMPEHTPERVRARSVECSNCGAPITLHDPEGTQRIGCEHCGAVLASEGEATRAVEAQKKLKSRPAIPLGSSGEFFGEQQTVIGFLQRHVRWEGRSYPWREYLLRTSEGGYRWLVENDGHWAYVRPMSPDAVEGRGLKVRCRDEQYKHFSSGDAYVDTVLGELYWDVEVGEQAETDDYVFGDQMLSLERTETEIQASHGVHVEAEEVKQAFGVEGKLPRQKGVGMVQPNRHKPGMLWGMYAGFVLLAVLMLVFFQGTFEKRVVVAGDFGPVPPTEVEHNVQITAPFELTADPGNLRIALEVPGLDNGWVGVEGALVNETTGDVTVFGVEAQRFSGAGWTEGDRKGSTKLGSLAAGQYVLRLDPVGYQGGFNRNYKITATSQVPSVTPFFCSLIFLVLFPLYSVIRWMIFESGRWENSDHPWSSSE